MIPKNKKVIKWFRAVLPYLMTALFCSNIGRAWRLAEVNDGSKLLVFIKILPVCLKRIIPSFSPFDLLIGAACGGLLNSFSFNDALLTALFGTPNRQNTMDRLGVVCTAFPDEDFRTAAVILRERIRKMDDFSWTALCKLSKWEISQMFDSESFLFDTEDEIDEEEDDEDDAYES